MGATVSGAGGLSQVKGQVVFRNRKNRFTFSAGFRR